MCIYLHKSLKAREIKNKLQILEMWKKTECEMKTIVFNSFNVEYPYKIDLMLELLIGWNLNGEIGYN